MWALIASWLGPSPPPPDPRAGSGQPEWSVPSDKTFVEREAAHQTILRIQPWGKSSSSSQQKDDQKTALWRLHGVILEEHYRYALILADGRIQRYKRGDALPGGGTLVSIDADSVEIAIKDRKQSMRLYRSPEIFDEIPVEKTY